MRSAVGGRRAFSGLAEPRCIEPQALPAEYKGFCSLTQGVRTEPRRFGAEYKWFFTLTQGVRTEPRRFGAEYKWVLYSDTRRPDRAATLCGRVQMVFYSDTRRPDRAATLRGGAARGCGRGARAGRGRREAVGGEWRLLIADREGSGCAKIRSGTLRARPAAGRRSYLGERCSNGRHLKSDFLAINRLISWP
jgi:hypothetical protein